MRRWKRASVRVPDGGLVIRADETQLRSMQDAEPRTSTRKPRRPAARPPPQFLYSGIGFRLRLLAVVVKTLYREVQQPAMEELEDLVRDLVETPSYDDEADCGDLVESWLKRETDAEVEQDDAGNVFARRGDPVFAIVGHHDTVPPADGQLDASGTPTFEVRDGRWYGRGTADMKAALAAAMTAFRDSTADDVAFASFVGEERGGEGARHAVENGFQPRRAVVVEGSASYSEGGSVDVAVGHRGRRELHLLARGRATHAAVASDDDNAVYHAFDEVERIRSQSPGEYETAAGTLEGSVTVTGVEAQGRSNVVPDRCTLTVDERTVPGGAVYEPFYVSLEEVDEMPAMECDDAVLVEAALEACERDGAAEKVVKPHATDAGHLDSAGVDCVVVGPAEKGEAHSDGESVSIEAVERCRGIYRQLFDDERLK